MTTTTTTTTTTMLTNDELALINHFVMSYYGCFVDYDEEEALHYADTMREDLYRVLPKMTVKQRQGALQYIKELLYECDCFEVRNFSAAMNSWTYIFD